MLSRRGGYPFDYKPIKADFHFYFLFCHMQAKWFAYSVLRYDNQALFASDSMLF